MITVKNEWEPNYLNTCIIVSNYFENFQDKTIVHYPFNELINASKTIYDIGVWKIKQLKK